MSLAPRQNRAEESRMRCFVGATLWAMLAIAPAADCAPSGDALPANVAAALDRAGIPQRDVGAYARDLTADRELLSFNAGRPMNPASAMKLITTFCALETLGPAYKWKTEAWLDGTLEGDRLVGNLVLKGYGDPRLDLERFWAFLRDLRHRGLREITGDLLLDRTYFAIEPHDPALFDNEPHRPYNVGADALLIHEKSFRLQFVPNDATHSVGIYAEPDLPQILVVNNLRLAAGDCDAWPEKPSIEGNVLRFAGAFPSGCGEKFRYFSLLGADEYAQTVFRQLWAQVGGSFSGRVQPAPVPPGSIWFASTESAPLSEVIRDVNKHSVNVMARQIFLTLGAHDDPPATLEKSQRAISDCLARRTLPSADLAIENGAGLSRTDRISARDLARILEAAYASPLMPEYVASLSLPGIDGTMKIRLAGSPATGRSHLKTGYIDGVRAIAGYALDDRGHMLALVLIVNHPDARNTQAAQDALLEWAHAGSLR